MVGDVRDVITCARLQIEIFMGYDFIRGRIFDFPIDFLHGPYNSAALMIITPLNRSYAIDRCCLSVILSVSRITHERVYGCRPNNV